MPGISIKDQDIRELYKSTPEGRRELGFYSDKFFSKYYLGTTLYPCQEQWITTLRKTRRGAVLAPVEHGKTYAISHFIPIKTICYNRNVRMLDISATADLARKNLGVVSRTFESNERLINDFGVFYDRKVSDSWTKSQIQVVRPDTLLKDYTLEAIGVFGEITGSRFDFILGDDIVSEKNSRTEEPRNRLRDFMFGTVFPRLDDKGLIWLIGTRKDYMDLWNDLIQKKAIWVVSIEKAIVVEPDHYEIKELKQPKILEDNTEQRYEVVITGDRGQVLDPVRWPMERLLLQRYNLGTRLFDREALYTITSDVTLLFQLPWLEQCRRDDLSYVDYDIVIDNNGKIVERDKIPIGLWDELLKRDLRQYIRIFEACDPSVAIDKKTAEKHDTSYMVSFLIGLKDNGNFDILHVFRNRGLSPNQKLEITKLLHQKFNPYCFFWESNAAGSMDIASIKEKSGVRIIPHHTGANKQDAYAGVPRLSVMYENGRIGLPYKTERDKWITDELISEFHRFPQGEHDDQVMAMWIGYAGTDRLLREWRIMKERQLV
jgi:phage terminase large subunit-like protein